MVARLAVRSLHAELLLYPKPGLVSAHDNGSHIDMDAATFMRSLFALRGYFQQITQAGFEAADFAVLSDLGIAAERRMFLATRGVNTHRGAIFCLGMLCAAAGHVIRRSARPGACTADAIRAALIGRWGAALVRHCERRAPTAHGTSAALVHGIGGARAQGAAGMPAVFDIALPALVRTLAAGRDWQCARIDALFALMAHLDDTNVYHRGGASGAAIVQEHGRRFLERGGTADPHWHASAMATHRLFVEGRLSPGGTADLLAAAILVHQLTQDWPPVRARARAQAVGRHRS